MTTAQIPTFDLSEFDQDKQAFAKKLGDGFRKYGFAGFKSHGVNDETIARAYASAKAFFALPEDVKARYDSHPLRGYTGFGVETAKDSDHPDLKEFYQLGMENPPDHPDTEDLPENVWPREVINFKRDMTALYDELYQLSRKVLSALAIYLQQDEDFFDKAIHASTSLMRPIHYPPIDDLETPAMRSGEHEDIDAVTMLIGSNEPGLEILSRSGEWIPVTTVEGTIVCNIGDMLQRLSNDILPSTTHRVVNPPGAHRLQPRFSMPFFCQFNDSFLIKTLDSCINKDNPNRYPEPITAKDFLAIRCYEIGLSDTLPKHLEKFNISGRNQRVGEKPKP